MDIKFFKQITDFNKLGESYNITPNKVSDADQTSIFDMFKGADKNGNGKLDNSEINSLYKDLELNYSEYDELQKLAEEFNKLYAEMNGLEDGIIELPETEDISTDATNGTNGNNGTNSVGDGNKPGNTKGSKLPTNTGDNGTTQKSLENMTLEELEAEKTSKQEEVDKARQNINAVYAGENDAVKDANKAVEEAQKNYDEIMKEAVEQEVITEELNERRQQNLTDISNKEKVIDGINIDINNKEGEIETKEGEISNAESNLSALKSALKSYDNAEEKDGEDIEGKKESIQKQINAEEENIKNLKEQKEQLEKDKTTLESNLEKEETALKTEKTAIEQEITTATQNASPVLKMAIQQAMTDYNNSKANVETVKTEQLSTARTELKTAEAGLKEVNKVYEEKSHKSIEGKNSYKTTEMEALVNYFGEEYLSVLSQEEIDRIIKLAKTNQMANIYPGKGSACLGICYEYEKWATGLSGKNHPFETPDLDTAIQKMAAVLNSGSPVIAKVNTQKGSRHFVMVIGIKQGATSPYKQSDFLCIDSYNGQVDGMGGSGNIEGNYRTLYMQRGNYWIGSRATNFA